MLETVLITAGIIAFIIIIDLILSFEQYKKNLLFWKIELKSYKIKIVKTKRGEMNVDIGIAIIVGTIVGTTVGACIGGGAIYAGLQKIDDTVNKQK